MKTNKNISNFASSLLLAWSLAMSMALAAQDAGEKPKNAQGPQQQDRENRESERAYQQARKLVDKGQWEEALKALNDAIAKGGSRADGALYWKAYVQGKLNQRAEAMETLAELKKTFPESRWLNDAKALDV